MVCDCQVFVHVKYYFNLAYLKKPFMLGDTLGNDSKSDPEYLPSYDYETINTLYVFNCIN